MNQGCQTCGLQGSAIWLSWVILLIKHIFSSGEKRSVLPATAVWLCRRSILITLLPQGSCREAASITFPEGSGDPVMRATSCKTIERLPSLPLYRCSPPPKIPACWIQGGKEDERIWLFYPRESSGDLRTEVCTHVMENPWVAHGSENATLS